ncbi:Replication factor C subunit 1 [Camelus dromedarius]|uniref:Replication factor C subunit 1 n=1 Tax=Camelus dromedarius TaxID=9838 RepID=A0A5N4EFB3_CAMDR|nr:Replication factor C subunit 1 [Camelus dromedarius]
MVKLKSDEEDDFVCKKAASKSKENGGSTNSYLGASNMKKNEEYTKTKNKPLSPIKLTPTSVLDYFGTGSVQRSDKKMVASRRKEPPQNADDSRLKDEAIARQLQLDEDAELERQLHEDEEFARTLAMLDEEPKSKKALKDPEEREMFSSVQANLCKAVKPKYPHKVKAEQFSDERKNCSPKKRTKCESSKESQHSRSSAHKTGETSSPKASSKLAALKKREESSYKKTEPLGSKRKENAIELKETRTPKKIKSSPAKQESISPEDSEKRRSNYQAYRSYLNREGPKALGSKEIPKGAENCLEGLTFVITGVLESIERDEAKSLIERYGGKVTGNVSKKTNYLVRGRDSGQSKSDKAAALGTKIIDEDGLLNLIRTMPGKKSKYEIAAEAEMKKEKSKLERTPQKNDRGKRKISPTKKESESKKCQLTPQRESSIKSIKKETSVFRRGLDFKEQVAEETNGDSRARNLADDSSENKVENLLWVDKYKPTSLKTIIGQQGDQSCANKLLRWLQNWHKSPSEDKKCGDFTTSFIFVCVSAKVGKFAGKDDGSSFKAALLSGPPGVGKTTTASLVCQELGYSYVELNASDTRSKNSLKEIVAESLNNTSIKGFCSSMWSFVQFSFEGDNSFPFVKFQGAMMSIAFKEGLKIPPPAMNEIILGANQDIRQVLHNLSMWCARSKALTYDQAKADSHRAKKDIKLENYIHVKPVAAGGDMKKHLMLLSRAADSICDGDLVDRQIRNKQNWSLLPTQAIYASVLPGELMRGYMTQFPTFPSWLGRHSSMGKHDRIVQDLALHMSLRTYSSKRTVNVDYLSHIRDALVQPLTSQGIEGVQDVVALMDAYYLMKEDFENIMEISSWGGRPSPFSKLDPKVKAAFTRAYNKEVHLTPYSLQVVKTHRLSTGPALDSEYNEELNEDDSQSDEKDQDTLETDAMIKVVF